MGMRVISREAASVGAAGSCGKNAARAIDRPIHRAKVKPGAV
jgi:hypothetical protein